MSGMVKSIEGGRTSKAKSRSGTISYRINIGEEP